jgi:hypothetical protein
MINEFSGTIIRLSIVFIVINCALLNKRVYLFLLYSEFMARSYDSTVLILRGPMPHPYIGSLDGSIVFLDPGLALKSQMRSHHLLTVAHLTIHLISLESCTSELFWLSSAIEFIWNGRELALFLHEIEVFKVLTKHAWIDGLELGIMSSTTYSASLCSFNQISLALGWVNSNLRSFFFLNEYLYSIGRYYFLKFVPFVFYIECWLQSTHWV